MESFDNLLKKIEKNFREKDKKEVVEIEIKDSKYQLTLLSREEKMEILFSDKRTARSSKEIFEWMKPIIYKSLNLKELALKAKENGYIKTYYEVIEMLFEPDEIKLIIEFILDKNNLSSFIDEETAVIKK